LRGAVQWGQSGLVARVDASLRIQQERGEPALIAGRGGVQGRALELPFRLQVCARGDKRRRHGGVA